METALQFIQEQMDKLSIPYEFGEWTQNITYPYYVGEITEEPITTEDGLQRSTIIINGFHRGAYVDLLTDAANMKKHFHPIHGLRASTNEGAIAVFYENAFFVPTNEAGLKRIQINLSVKEWKGAL